MTRIDLTELNDARTKVNRLEGACEALDLVRTAVIGAESKIQRTEANYSMTIDEMITDFTEQQSKVKAEVAEIKDALKTREDQLLRLKEQ